MTKSKELETVSEINNRFKEITANHAAFFKNDESGRTSFNAIQGDIQNVYKCVKRNEDNCDLTINNLSENLKQLSHILQNEHSEIKEEIDALSETVNSLSNS